MSLNSSKNENELKQAARGKCNNPLLESMSYTVYASFIILSHPGGEKAVKEVTERVFRHALIDWQYSFPCPPDHPSEQSASTHDPLDRQ